ncbi:hypothetical protein DM860_014937 [Cuscuta australis]|uniref:Uncharacterized protein n=1 Tax=Cuscuta australis TaxID=267555 RepID=A0A328E3I8_9ASTE|nr:hypothetical protein DM860_014937 [Cuscuta australis]
MNMAAAAAAAGESNERGGILNLDEISGKVRKLWDNSPQPVKIFPWNSVLDNLIHSILDLLLCVVKFLWVPLRANQVRIMDPIVNYEDDHHSEDESVQQNDSQNMSMNQNVPHQEMNGGPARVP